MKNSILFLFFVILLSGVFSACKAQNIQSWTSMNPLSIPLKIREDYYNRGNLVSNPSFEKVNIFNNDSIITNFKLSHWDVIGKDVQLTDITHNNSYDSTEAFQGIHAIKIIRTDKDVKEINNPTEGVLSDFIKVMPANYDFYFDIRLNKIIPAAYPYNRFQRRIGKDIDIHLQFYDKNKKEINQGVYFEYVNKKIDDSFKGFAFSNYFYINQFNWGRVRGLTWHYPFSAGDLPDSCRYIKIFLGLKCKGTMWVDNIDFHLSRWNFTPMERENSFFRKKYDLTELMIPMPKVIKNRQHIKLESSHIKLIYKGTTSTETKDAIALLNSRFSRVNDDSINLYRSDKSLPSSAGLEIILIKNNQPYSTEFKDAFQAIKDKDQAYFIRKKGDKIYLGANEPKGLFYAATSLSQLIDYSASMLDYADITDFPDFTGRSSLLMNYNNKWSLEQNKSLSDSAIQERLKIRQENLKKQLKDIDFYAFYKINTLYSLYFILSKRWWLPGDFYKTLFKKTGERCAQYGDIINTAVQINPYFHIDMEQREDTLSDSLRHIFSHGTDAGFEKIINTLKPALDAGAKTVMLCADDYVPHSGIIRGEYTLFTKPDKAEFTNLADAQDYLLNKLKSWLDKNYGNIRLEFVPPPYNNRFIDYSRGSAETYFRDLARRLDSSVVLVWTGNTIRSLSYDMADIRRSAGVYKRKPMIWDNSPYARIVESKNGGYPVNYPQKAVMCDLFEPFDIHYPKNFPDYVNSHYYSNLSGFGEINKIKYLTFADFAWNTKDYNPDFSLFKALVRYAGRDNARLLLKFNDAYYQFVSSWGQLRIDIEHNPDFQCSEKQKERAEQEIKVMKKTFDALKPIDNEDLKKELENIMNAKIDVWHLLIEKASINKKT